MSKKDYVLIAKVIMAERITWCKDAIIAHKAIDSIAHTLAQTLKLENPRFDSDRFLTACGITK